MMTRSALISAALSGAAALAYSLPAQAQPSPKVMTAISPGSSQDIAAGKQIATSGASGGKVAACASCHGAQGEGNAASGFPSIAGQSAAYLAHQLEAYRQGTRDNPIMGPIAKALTPEQISHVTGYYATLAPTASKAESKAAASVMKRGQTLATVGDNKIGVQACANCHGPGGAGEPPAYPYLASQHASYLGTTLQSWKSGARKTDPSQQMNVIAQRLPDSDIKAVGAYFAAQPAPPSAVAMAMSQAAPQPAAGNRASSNAGPATATPAQGIGTEQGAPTTGGAQGPGGGGGASGAGPSGSRTGTAK